MHVSPGKKKRQTKKTRKVRGVELSVSQGGQHAHTLPFSESVVLPVREGKDDSEIDHLMLSKTFNKRRYQFAELAVVLTSSPSLTVTKHRPRDKTH